MATYIALLRGINVGGKRIVKMDVLKKMFESLGFEHVKTYIQSGNIIFHSPDSDLVNLELTITTAILKNFELEVPVIVLSVEELYQIIEKNPFQKTKEVNYLHINFLSSVPKKEYLDILSNTSFTSDDFCVIGRAVYLYCPNSYSNTKLTNTFFEKNLKVMTTTRNWKTSNELLALAQNL